MCPQNNTVPKFGFVDVCTDFVFRKLGKGIFSFAEVFVYFGPSCADDGSLFCLVISFLGNELSYQKCFIKLLSDVSCRTTHVSFHKFSPGFQSKPFGIILILSTKTNFLQSSLPTCQCNLPTKHKKNFSLNSLGSVIFSFFHFLDILSVLQIKFSLLTFLKCIDSSTYICGSSSSSSSCLFKCKVVFIKRMEI
jgi:hypothetical protein